MPPHLRCLTHLHFKIPRCRFAGVAQRVPALHLQVPHLRCLTHLHVKIPRCRVAGVTQRVPVLHPQVPPHLRCLTHLHVKIPRCPVAGVAQRVPALHLQVLYSGLTHLHVKIPRCRVAGVAQRVPALHLQVPHLHAGVQAARDAGEPPQQAPPQHQARVRTRAESAHPQAAARLLLSALRQGRHIVEELCESRGGRPGLSVLTSLPVSVDVKIY